MNSVFRLPAPPAGRLRQLQAAYLRWADSKFPEALRADDPEALRRARIVVSLGLVLVVLGVEAIVFFHLTLPRAASIWLEVSLLTGVGMVLWVPAAVRRTGSTALAANLVIGGAYTVILTTIVVLGGIRAPILHWCALLPMLAVLMGTRRAAWGWGAVAVLTLAGAAAADIAQLDVPDFLIDSELTGARLWIQRSVDVSSWIGILLAIAMLYEINKDRQTEILAAANAELKREIEQRESAEARTHYLAYFDELTTLPNRELFKQQLKTAIFNAKRSQRVVGVLFVDLDGFKEVNDTYGHDLGDRVLRTVAERLTACVREVDSVARGGRNEQVVSRRGGDEFTVLLVDIRTPDEAGLVAKRILRSLELPLRVEGRDIYLSASIGIALGRGDDSSVDVLLRNADLAMYHAKESGRNNFQLFDESMLSGMARRSAISTDLHTALADGELELYYQPIVDVRSGIPVAFEALLRWRHATRGMLLPADFIQVAESTGQIASIGDWVLREACCQAAKWQRAGHRDVRVAVNVSGLQIRGGNFCATVEAALRDAGIASKTLDLEITENAVMIDEAEMAHELRRLKALGVGIALDDFGTGYSSLSNVRHFPVDSLKIDRSFVGEIAAAPAAEAITAAMITLAHELGLRVVAEGVETAEQQAFLAARGCDALQGYRLGAPQPADGTLGVLAAGGQPLPGPDACGGARTAQ